MYIGLQFYKLFVFSIALMDVWFTREITRRAAKSANKTITLPEAVLITLGKLSNGCFVLFFVFDVKMFDKQTNKRYLISSRRTDNTIIKPYLFTSSSVLVFFFCLFFYGFCLENGSFLVFLFDQRFFFQFLSLLSDDYSV